MTDHVRRIDRILAPGYIEGIDRALEMVVARRGKAYDPALTDLVLDGARSWWERWTGSTRETPRSLWRHRVLR